MVIYGRQLNAVEVSDPETFFANGNKPAEFFTSLYCGERLRGMGCKGEQQWREPKRSENHCRYGEWKMVFCVHPDLALTCCHRYRWCWINAESTMTPRAPATRSAVES